MFLPGGWRPLIDELDRRLLDRHFFFMLLELVMLAVSLRGLGHEHHRQHPEHECLDQPNKEFKSQEK
jgi:hypothetical protein